MSRNAGSSLEKLVGTLVAILAVAAAGVASYLVLERLADRPMLNAVVPAGAASASSGRTDEDGGKRR
ncbi:MAG TPA: hypothetical protein PK280_05045 [Planctomycetota bacterium]|nr:hypothetical protein [Planctomycetota bacterium]